MSKAAEAAVWKRSRAKGSNRLVLVRIADCCSEDDGTFAFPSVQFLARETLLTERAVQYILHRLERDGEIAIDRNVEGQFVEIRGRRFQPPWFIHVRCACDWETYQRHEQSEKFASSAFTRGRRRSKPENENFAHSAAADKRKDFGANRTPVRTKPKNHVEHIRKDPSVDPGSEQEQGSLALPPAQAGAPPRPPEAKPDPPNDNIGVITTLVHESIELWGDVEGLDEIVKCRIATLNHGHSERSKIQYNSAVVNGAIASARWQRAHRRQAGA